LGEIGRHSETKIEGAGFSILRRKAAATGKVELSVPFFRSHPKEAFFDPFARLVRTAERNGMPAAVES
jgi:hypothetical protein